MGYFLVHDRGDALTTGFEGALAGIEVLDLAGTIASGYCGKLFADHGARVVNVEPPDGGFDTRREPPLLPGVEEPENSALHAYLSTNKTSVALDADAEPGRLAALAENAAVVLDAGRFEPADFPAAPNVVVSTITWFGRTGPYADFQGAGGICWSLAGMVRTVGRAEGPPLMPAGCGAEVVGGLAAYIGTLGQVIAREIGNAAGPVRLDTSIFEANLCFTEVGGVGGYRSGRRSRRLGVNRFAPTYPLGVYACADGWLGVTALTPRQWKSFCALLGMEQYADVPEYQTAIGRLLDYDRLEPVIKELVRERSVRELVERGQDAAFRWCRYPPWRSCSRWISTSPGAPSPASKTGAGGRLPGAGDAVSSVPDASAGRWAFAPARRSQCGAAAMSRPELLAGVRVVDLSMGWAGPLAARHLADMGADVIKVEGCVRFDWWRGWEATQEWIDADGAERNPAFNMVNRNKRDLTLDLSTTVGSDLLKRLVAIADVVVENYSAGVLPKLGLDYPALAAVNPALVMISMPAFGTNGPWRGYRAYGSTVEQASGLPHLSGAADLPAHHGACGARRLRGWPQRRRCPADGAARQAPHRARPASGSVAVRMPVPAGRRGHSHAVGHWRSAVAPRQTVPRGTRPTASTPARATTSGSPSRCCRRTSGAPLRTSPASPASARSPIASAGWTNSTAPWPPSPPNRWPRC